MKVFFASVVFMGMLLFVGIVCPVPAAEKSPYMGGEFNLTKAPNGAVVREEVLKTAARILYLEPTTEKLADSVGENAGMKLNDKGGIDIYIATQKPKGVPEENWLPINRKDEDIGAIMRIYIPDIERMKTWSPPKAEKII